MELEPILLKASLRAIFDRGSNTFRTLVKCYELLIKLLAVFVFVIRRCISILLVFPEMLQRALIVPALAYVDHLVIRWRRRHLLLEMLLLLLIILVLIVVLILFSLLVLYIA